MNAFDMLNNARTHGHIETASYDEVMVADAIGQGLLSPIGNGRAVITVEGMAFLNPHQDDEDDC